MMRVWRQLEFGRAIDDFVIALSLLTLEEAFAHDSTWVWLMVRRGLFTELPES